MKGGGGEAVQKWENRAAPPCVDRSSTCCRPVDRCTEANLKWERKRGKGGRKSKDFGAKTKVFIG